MARTLTDLARHRSRAAALVPWEAALWAARLEGRLDACREEVAGCVRAAARRTGAGRARWVAEFASAWSQSPAETRSRLVIHELGLPAPVQQLEVLDGRGALVGRSDFAWPELGVLGEYDGRGKYGELAVGSSREEVFWAEKRRQEGMEALGWVVVRWNREHLTHPQRLRDRIQQGFDRASGSTRLRSSTRVQTRVADRKAGG